MATKRKQPHKGYRFVWSLLLVPIALLLQQLCAQSPQVTESVYSRQIYPVLSGILSPIFGVFPFSTAQLILLVLIVLLVRGIVLGVMAFLRGRPFVIVRGVLKLLAVFSVGFFLFTTMWGLNYYRQPLVKTLAYRTGTPTAAELSAVLNREVGAVNALTDKIHYDKNDRSYYNGGFSAMRMQANEGYFRLNAPLAPKNRYVNMIKAWPKGLFPSEPVSYTGTAGIFIPFTYEPSINTAFPAFSLPFTISHETAHFKGYAREEEANFLAYLACGANPDVYFQYSGHMSAIQYLSNALYSTDSNLWRQDIDKLDTRAKKDLQFYADYVDKHQSKATDVANKVNDSYLKSQGQAGVVSYDAFVNLLCDQYRTNGQ